jgi:hypothetical protein
MRQAQVITVTQLLLALSLALAWPAFAGNWYKAESCIDESQIGGPKESCTIGDCQQSDESPKDVYDTASGIGDDSTITDREDGGVDVTDHERLNHVVNVDTFFRTAKACKEFTAPLLKAQKGRQQEEEKENAEMNQKYN